MTDSPSPAAQQLVKYANNGAWPYFPGNEPSTEATAWCAIACRRDYKMATESLEYLLSTQNPDGGWSTTAGCKPSDWSAGLVLLAIEVLKHSLSEIATSGDLVARAGKASTNATAYLMRTRAELINDFTRILMYISNFDYPRGWAWTPDTFEWVEPTSHAVLALAMIPQSADRSIRRVLDQAYQYFFDKFCPAGGWNYGVPISLGARMPRQPVPTAWALMALHGQSDAKIKEAIAYLQNTDDVTTQTLQAKALTILALKAHHINVHKRIVDLQEHFAYQGKFSTNLMLTAMCAIAIASGEEGNPLLPTSSRNSI